MDIIYTVKYKKRNKRNKVGKGKKERRMNNVITMTYIFFP